MGRGAKKSLGQHFLIDARARAKIVDAVGATSTDEVLEIGPGRGALTELMVGVVGRLVVVEIDDDLAADLQDRWGDRPDFTVVHGDVLDFQLASLVADPDEFRVVGNLPYGITGPLFGRLMEHPRPRCAVVMVQAEVGERILAAPGSKTYGALSVGVQSVFTPRRVMRVPRGSFRPVPGVDSLVLALDRIDPPKLSVEEETRLRGLVRASFQWRRKQMGTILKRHPDLAAVRDQVEAALVATSIDPKARPETLSSDDFLGLLRSLETPD